MTKMKITGSFGRNFIRKNAHPRYSIRLLAAQESFQSRRIGERKNAPSLSSTFDRVGLPCRERDYFFIKLVWLATHSHLPS